MEARRPGPSSPHDIIAAMPPDRRHLQVNGLGVAYRESGPATAPALLLIHGLASSSRMWIETMSALSPHYHCVALDLPGHGGSSTPTKSWYSIANYAQLIEAVRRDLALEPLVVCGHSMGAMIALRMVVENSYLASHLVLVAPIFEGSKLPYQHRVQILTEGLLTGPVSGFLRFGVALYGRIPLAFRPGPEARERRKRQDLLELDVDSVMASLRSLVNSDVDLDGGARGRRSLIITGCRDRTGARDQSRRLAGQLARAESVELPAGHHPFYEAEIAYHQTLQGWLGKLKER